MQTGAPSGRTLFYHRVTARIWRYAPPSLLFAGTIGNVLSGVVMLRRRLRSSNTSLFLAVLAVVDTLCLWTGLTRSYVKRNSGFDIRNYHPVLCKLQTFATFCVPQISAGILVCMTIERGFAIFFPHQSKRYCSKKSCSVALIAMSISLTALNANLFVIMDMVEYPGTCAPRAQFYSFFVHVWPWIDFVFASALPFVVLIVANTGIVLKISISNYVRKHKMNQASGGVKMTSMTVTLLTVSLVFLITTAPISVYLILQENFVKNLTPEQSAWADLWWAVVLNLFYVNNSCNFLLYCVTGPRFRKELQLMLFPRRQVHPSTLTEAT